MAIRYDQLPHDHALEREVLSSVFVAPDSLWAIREQLRDVDFHEPIHAALYTAMIAVQDRDGRVDIPLLHTELRQRGQGALIAHIGGVLERAGTTDQLHRYVTRVAEYAMLRRMAQASEGVTAGALTPEAAADVNGWAAEAIRAVEDAAGHGPATTMELASDAMPEAYLTMLDEKTTGLSAGLKTGIPELDEWTNGLPRKMHVIGGRAKMGKTAFAMSLTKGWACNGLRGLWLQQEMDKREFWARNLALVSHVPFAAVAGEDAITAEQGLLLQQAANTIRGWRMAVDYRTRLTAADVKLLALKARRLLGGLDYVVVDHFHAMDHGGGGSMTEQRAGMGANSNGLRDTAKELNVCLLLLAQLNRGTDKRSDQRPVLSDLRECGDLEQDAHVIMAPHRPYYYDQTADRRDAELVVMGNRNGDKGIVQLRFLPQVMEFRKAV